MYCSIFSLNYHLPTWIHVIINQMFFFLYNSNLLPYYLVCHQKSVFHPNVHTIYQSLY